MWVRWVVVNHSQGGTILEGTAKLSQNKSIDTIRGVVKGLTESPDKLAHDVADLMQRNLEMLEKRI